MRVAILVLSLLLAGCAKMPGVSESWHGHHVDELVAAWGPPDGEHVNADGSRLVSWSHQHQMTGLHAIPHAVYYCSAVFAVTPGGIVESSRVDGNLGGCNSLARTKRAAF